MTFAESMTAHAHEYLTSCLEQSQGNVVKAAKIAGVHRATFYSLCKKSGVMIRQAKLPVFAQWLVAPSP